MSPKPKLLAQGCMSYEAEKIAILNVLLLCGHALLQCVYGHVRGTKNVTFWVKNKVVRINAKLIPDENVHNF
jgi:hypothetical protein